MGIELLPRTLAIPAGIVLHELPLGDGRSLVVDVAAGQVSGQDAAGVEAQLAYLYWAWEHAPLPSPTCLWQIQAAALAVASEYSALRKRAAIGLNQAIRDICSSRLDLPLAVRQLLTEIETALEVSGPGSGDDVLPTNGLLGDLVNELRAFVRGRRKSAGELTTGFVIDVDPPSAFEPEWDRTRWLLLDPREHSVRARVTPTSWIASAAALPHANGNVVASEPLWARLVHRETSKVLAKAEMDLIDCQYVCRSKLVEPIGTDDWRIDLVASPEITPRSKNELALVHATQGVYRALALSRLAGVTHPEWSRTQCHRAARKLNAYLELTNSTAGLGVTQKLGGTVAEAAQPFLAEEHLSPQLIARIASPLDG